MADNSARPIIIKRKKVVAGGGHHGGAWKVAMSSFLSSVMAPVCAGSGPCGDCRIHVILTFASSEIHQTRHPSVQDRNSDESSNNLLRKTAISVAFEMVFRRLLTALLDLGFWAADHI